MNTGIKGWSTSIYGSIIAFFSPNFDYDNKLCYYNISSESLYETGVSGTFIPSVGDSIIAFNTAENSIGTDLNGDGDTHDWILRYFDIATEQTVDLGFDSGFAPSVSGSIIAFTTWESDVGVDLNGDGNIGGNAIRYYDISTHELKNTGINGAINSTSLSGSIITCLNREFNYGGVYYNILTGLTEDMNFGMQAAASIDGSIVTFFIRERNTGLDLNGDGDANDSFVQYIDISQSIFDTSIGSDVTVNSVGTGGSVTFSEVVTSGETTVSVSTTNPGSEVSNFEFLNTYTAISTDATFEGPVILSFNYDPSITGQAENTLRVFHWDGSEWTDVTYDLDTVNDVIYAQTTSFSWFALAYKPYEYSGLLQPINSDGSSIFKLKSTVPVKFQLKDDLGNFVSNAEAKIYLAKIGSAILGTELETISTSASTEGNVFRCSQNQYIFNLNTKSLSVGTWQIRIDLDDGTSKYGKISLT